jgi:hypothetical protein
MMSRNTIEEELNATRIKLYEITKDMTRGERVAYIKNRSCTQCVDEYL